MAEAAAAPALSLAPRRSIRRYKRIRGGGGNGGAAERGRDWTPATKGVTMISLKDVL